MRTAILILAASAFFVSCNNSGSGATFCDTVCNGKEIVLNGDGDFNQELTISLKDCAGDTVAWTHGKTFMKKKIHLPEFLDKTVKLNKSAVTAFFQDTTQIWLSFNDCISGRGYLLKLPYSSSDYKKITGALNSFDPKFAVDPDLRAYTDRGNLYVANVRTGQEVSMTFKKEYDIDFDNLHESVDSVNVNKQKMFIRLIDKDGSKKEFEKTIQL